MDKGSTEQDPRGSDGQRARAEGTKLGQGLVGFVARAHLHTLVVLFALTLCGCQARSGDQAARDELRAELERYRHAILTGSPESLATWYTEDAVLFGPEMHDIRGRSAIREFFASVGAAVRVKRVAFETRELTVYQGCAYELGRYDETLELVDRRTVESHGRYLLMWQQQPDRRWRIHRVMLAPATNS